MVGRVEQPLIRLFAVNQENQFLKRVFQTCSQISSFSFSGIDREIERLIISISHVRIVSKFRGLHSRASFENLSILPRSNYFLRYFFFRLKARFTTSGYGLHSKTSLSPFRSSNDPNPGSGFFDDEKKLSPISWKESIGERQSRGTIGPELIRR